VYAVFIARFHSGFNKTGEKRRLRRSRDTGESQNRFKNRFIFLGTSVVSNALGETKIRKNLRAYLFQRPSTFLHATYTSRIATERQECREYRARPWFDWRWCTWL